MASSKASTVRATENATRASQSLSFSSASYSFLSDLPARSRTGSPHLPTGTFISVDPRNPYEIYVLFTSPVPSSPGVQPAPSDASKRHPMCTEMWPGAVLVFVVLFSEGYPCEGPRTRYIGPHRLFHPNIECGSDMAKKGEERREESAVTVEGPRDSTVVFANKNTASGRNEALEQMEDAPIQAVPDLSNLPHHSYHCVEKDDREDEEGGVMHHRLHSSQYDRCSTHKGWGVCLGLQFAWRPTFTFLDILLSLWMLLENPNAEDPLPGNCQVAAKMWLAGDREAYIATAKGWIQGNYAIVR